MTNWSQIRNHSQRLMLVLLCALLVSGLVAMGRVDKRAQLSKPPVKAVPQNLTNCRRGSNRFLGTQTNPLLADGIINVNSTAQSAGVTGDCTLGEAIQFTGNKSIDGGAISYHGGAGGNLEISLSVFTNNQALGSNGFGEAEVYSCSLLSLTRRQPTASFVSQFPEDRYQEDLNVHNPKTLRLLLSSSLSAQHRPRPS